jgi:hypothetical protein
MVFGWVFLDVNGDGRRQNSEQLGLTGVWLTLEQGSQPVAQTRSVGTDGWYQFNSVAAGPYSLSAAIPAGYLPTSPTRVWFQVIAGQSRVVNFGVRPAPTATPTPTNTPLPPTPTPTMLPTRRPPPVPMAVIGDYVWYDANHNGLQDVGEPGISNVTVALYRDNGDGLLNPTIDTLVNTSLTDADGGYLLKAVATGLYFLDVTDDHGLLAGLTHTAGLQSRPAPWGPLTVTWGGIYRDADFGYVLEPAPGHAIIGDTVWYDGDGDGAWDPGEPGAAGVTVCAAPAGPGAAICATTDANGVYRLAVPAGVYTVRPTDPPAGLTASLPVPHGPITLAAGAQYLDADFGYTSGITTLGNVGNLLWYDLLANGQFEPDLETGIAGVSVSLIQDSNGNQTWDPGEPIIATTTSDTNGAYLFTGVPAGDYLVWVSDTADALHNFNRTIPGPVPGADNNNQTLPCAVRLTAGASDLTADFGYMLWNNQGMIGNQVWYETDDNGRFNPERGDVGLAGVTVDLYQPWGFYATTTTGASGRYVFAGLPAGQYSVWVSDRFGVLAGYVVTVLGQNPGQDNQNQAQPYTVSLSAGGRDLTADFGYRPAP